MNQPPPLRYNAFNRYLRRRYGGRIQKIPLDAGFGCPHREGRDGRQAGGCIYCENASFSPGSGPQPLPLAEQLERGIRQGLRRYKARGFIAYFQAYTNTYGPPELLRERFDVIRDFPGVVGMAVGTRPDCVDPEVLDLVHAYCGRYEVWMEYGLQSGNDHTLRRIQRGHLVADFLRAVELTSRRGMLICAHVILGLPGEGRREMMHTARLLAGLPVHGVKIHHCHVIRGTPLEEEYNRGRYRPMVYEPYLSQVCDFLEVLPWPITIHRLMGDAPAALLAAPKWKQTKPDLLRDVQAELVRRGTCQGARAGR
jgi:radical SAM protein (TIGR01212 family)